MTAAGMDNPCDSIAGQPIAVYLEYPSKEDGFEGYTTLADMDYSPIRFFFCQHNLCNAPGLSFPPVRCLPAIIQVSDYVCARTPIHYNLCATDQRGAMMVSDRSLLAGVLADGRGFNASLCAAGYAG
eukprot:CAMPEP_0113672650 /NCGR_PEP_ID=MMETSP0038_2-20120614/6390_1 /TAXON_ID=2898 /ORGANISM="Cryptomonas paramecium" /LENGTH=126 /DNA_ID=CAMNT_0000588961 /DNA_START=405 /DNA_END=781 /DNA_ORIENTATION=- /assembly_acc=CAM_ASM_000170